MQRIDPNDIVGKRFEELTVDEVIGKDKNGAWRYNCTCTCGKKTTVTRSNLLFHHVKSCGHLNKTTFEPEKCVGMEFGDWTIISFSHRKKKHWYFLCRCKCGNENLIPWNSLKRGLTRSCGKCTEPWIEKCDEHCRYMYGNGKYFLFDYCDLPLVESRRWTLNIEGYPMEAVSNGQRLSRLILNLGPNEYADHINMDVADNRRSNLRVCTWSENNCNKVLQSNNSSGFKGVSFHKASGKYIASVWKDNVHHYGGLHATKEEAALAYDELARSIHGEFARLNFPREGERGCREAV